MEYLVDVTPHAERDLARLYRLVNAEFSEAALVWYLGIKEAILSLGKHPNRCPVTQKKDKLRHLLYGHKPNIYRVLYRVNDKQKKVEVLRVRHCSRQSLKAFDLM